MELTSGLADDELAAAEQAFRRAFSTGDAGGLEVLGHGEISSVVALGRHALKRLPPFDGRARFETYRALFQEYLERLAEAGVRVVPSFLQTVEADDGSVVAYCVQPVLEASRLGPRVLARAAADDAAAHASRLLGLILGTVGPRVGFDGQLANWALEDDGWTYLDVTTPLLRDAEGRDRLDADLFLAALPWVFRGLVRRFLLRAITDTYFDPRRVALDFLGNLYKERLERFVPAFVEIANQRLERSLTLRDVRSHYASDARLWTGLQALRRADRWWQLTVRRRPYPFLLPGRIDR